MSRKRRNLAPADSSHTLSKAARIAAPPASVTVNMPEA